LQIFPNFAFPSISILKFSDIFQKALLIIAIPTIFLNFGEKAADRNTPMLLFFSSCSTKKKSWINRQYHNTTAKFNGYFNGNESIKLGVKKIHENYTAQQGLTKLKDLIWKKPHKLGYHLI